MHKFTVYIITFSLFAIISNFIGSYSTFFLEFVLHMHTCMYNHNMIMQYTHHYISNMLLHTMFYYLYLLDCWNDHIVLLAQALLDAKVS